jgi:hypothetical protein
MYCLPPAGGRIRSQGNYYCLPPAGGRIRSQGNKMRRLEYRILYRVKDSRRRTREGAEVWAEGWT